MTVPKLSSEPLLSAKKFISRISLKQVKRLGNAHCGRYFHKAMDVVRHYLELVNANLVTKRCFAKKFFAIYFEPRVLENVLGVFRLPHKMVAVLSYAVRKFC